MRTCLIPLLVLSAVVACSKAAVPAVEPLVSYTLFTGSWEPQTRISVGGKEGSVYKAAWETGDALTVVDATTSEILGTATLVSGVGENSGVFQMDGTLSDGVTVILKYGQGGVATEQVQAGAGASSLAAYTSAASGIVEVRDGTGSFTLVHDPAIVKVSVGSTALSGATVGAVILRCIGGVLSGSDTDYVRVTLTEPLTLGADAQDVWLTANASDLTGKEVDVAFEVTAGSTRYTLPVGFAGKALKADTVNAFSIPALSDAKCVPWYEPHDSRTMDSPAYAYGEANTFFIQCKDGSSYTGATYVPDDAIPGAVAISIKARGDFLQVTNPVGATFEWARKGNTVYTMRTTGYASSGVDPTRYDISYDGATTVTVTNTGAYAGSPILLMKKEGKTLWSWTFWNIAADGTKVEPVSYGDYRLANMDIGQATTRGSDWSANKSGSNPDLLYRTVNRYQFGRHMPVFFETYWTIYNAENGETGNVPVRYAPVSLADYIADPVGLMANQTIDTDLNPWCSDMGRNIWGGLGEAEGGPKAVMDPCPKGWKVASKAALQAAKAGTVATETGAGYQGLYSNGSLFLRAGTCTAKTTINSSGLHVVSTEGGAATGTSGVGKWWSSYVAGKTSTSTYVLTASNTAFGESNYLLFACSCSVRCEVDKDNR